MIKRLCSPHVSDGKARDRFANRVSSRVFEEIAPPAVSGMRVVLVDNWIVKLVDLDGFYEFY
jgi:hypothetical protein